MLVAVFAAVLGPEFIMRLATNVLIQQLEQITDRF